MMFTESFADFFHKKRQARRPNLPKGNELWDAHDEHKDQVMHHLHSIHKLTHPRGDYSRILNKLGQGNMHVNDLHTAVSHAIKDHEKDHADRGRED